MIFAMWRFSSAENVVKSEFALPAFQQEAVDIEQEYDGKDRDDQLSYAHICPG